MFPLVVSTYPENGTDNVGLDDIIKVTFDGELDAATVTTDNVKLENYTTGNQMNITVTVVDGNTAIVVTASQTAAGNHRFEGLNSYRLIVSNIKTKAGELMDSTAQLRFSTIAGAPGEVVVDPTPGTSLFEVLRTDPRENSIKTRNLIRVKCSEAPAVDTDLTGIMLINDSSITDIEDALWMGQNLLTDTSCAINGDVIEITPPTLTSGTKYSVVITKVTNSSGDQIIPYMFSFNAAFSPMYTDVESLMDLHMVKELADGRTTIEVAKLIHLNSKLAEFIANLAENTSIDWTNPPMYVGEYVKYKTQYDIVFDTIAELSSKSTTKQLKDFMVDYRFSLNDLMNLAKQIKLKYQYWEDLLKGHKNRGNAKPGTFIKGEGVDEDPDYKNRALKLMDGTKEW